MSMGNCRRKNWMMGFLLVNILLGIVGTFWFRTQHRRGELGLRVAVGSTRMGLWHRLNKEASMNVWMQTVGWKQVGWPRKTL